MYEYSERGLGMTREVSGLGWSEQSTWSLDPSRSSKTGFICSPTPHGYGARQICFIENDPLEQATAQRSGCSRAQDRAFTGSRVLNCRTEQGNVGKIWCCPENAPQMIPTTPEQRARDTELLLAEQRAQEQGTLPETTSEHATKVARVENGQAEPASSQASVSSFLGKIQRHPEWVIAALAIGAGGFFGYRYFKRQYNRINIYSGVR